MNGTKLEYAFENIESLIQGAVDPSIKSSKPFEERFAQVRNTVAIERDRIKKSFALKVWALENSQRSHYVQYHQQRLIALIDELFEISRRKEEKGGVQSRISSEAFFLYDQLAEVLSLIRNELSEYFCRDVKVPESHKMKILASIQESYKNLQHRMDGKENKLIAICISHIKGFIEGMEPKTTYRKVQYMEVLTESISRFLQSNNDDLPEEEIRTFLVSVDFNSTAYFKYYTEFIQNQLAQLDSNSERLEQLAFHNKTINQIQLTPGIAYDPGSRGIRTQLSEWISEEVEFLERKRFLATNAQIAENDFAKKDFKLEFDMSVSQFAFFIKAFIETGVIQNKNISELIRFLSKFVKTKRSENISYESFRIKYYNVEGGTKDAVKNTFHTAIGFINSN